MNVEAKLASIGNIDSIIIFEGISVNQIYMTFDAMDSFYRPDFTDPFHAYHTLQKRLLAISRC